MSFLRDTVAKTSPPASRVRSWFVTVILRKIILRLRDRASIKKLLSLEDEQLDDIGLTRNDVVVALYRRSDPSEYLRHQAKKRKLAELSSRVQQLT